MSKHEIPEGLTYRQMVKNLFKHQPGNFGTGMHAAIGIAGEVVELSGAYSRDNLFEEAGDMEFYIEGMWIELQSFDKNIREQAIANACSEDLPMTLSDILPTLTNAAGQILDAAKKSWVYNNPPKIATIAAQLWRVECALMYLYEVVGTTDIEVKERNMVKLIGKTGRYASGKYSDEAAQARADKGGEE